MRLDLHKETPNELTVKISHILLNGEKQLLVTAFDTEEGWVRKYKHPFVKDEAGEAFEEEVVYGDVEVIFFEEQ